MTEAESTSRRWQNGLQSPVPYPLKQHRELIAAPPGATMACDSGTGSHVRWPLAPCISFSGLGVTLEGSSMHTQCGELASPAPPFPNLAFLECPMAGSDAHHHPTPPPQEELLGSNPGNQCVHGPSVGFENAQAWPFQDGVTGLSLVASDRASICQLLAQGGGDRCPVTWTPCTSSSLSLLLWGDRGGPFGICPTLTGLETRTPAAQLLPAGCGLGVTCALASAPAASRPPDAIPSFVLLASVLIKNASSQY